MTIKAFPFVEDADPKKIDINIENSPEEFVKNILNSNRFGFGVREIMKTGHYKLAGYKYDLRPFLNRYVYKQYYAWQETFALNKTNARKLIGGRIDEIVEIPAN